MAIVSLTQLKSYFNKFDKPTEQQYVDLIDTLANPSNNLRSVDYTIGLEGASGVDYNFSSVANSTAQSIQLGGTAIIPANSQVVSIVAKCTTALSGVITGTVTMGKTIGPISNEYMNNENLYSLNQIQVGSFGAAQTRPDSSNYSVYFNYTPSANWNTITTGSWKIWISYIDNTLL